MDMKKVSCAVIVAAATATVVVAEEVSSSPAPGPTSSSAMVTPALGLNDRVSLCNRILSSHPIIKGTVVLIRIAMGCTEKVSTAAIEPRQPYTLPASAASIGTLFRLRIPSLAQG
ncbi:hypothetical protein MRB53_017585 [Persea americana]|uniref:Uncharacterized protein n=1 Tax=Persea americana TaxID=3435 RepID=A0ACC2M5H1_PERAE|nr:hypothetical protein MRB53_017585 [Persea americana]